jgi:AAA domain
LKLIHPVKITLRRKIFSVISAGNVARTRITVIHAIQGVKMPPTRGVRKSRTTKPRQSGTDESPLAIEADSVTIEIESMAQFRESRNIALFGPSGHGKTVLAGGAPRSTFLTTEKGLSSAKSSGSSSGIMRAYDWEHILAGLRKADEVLGENDWLIVDSATKMQVLYMRWILRMQNQVNSSRSLDIPALQDHQQYQNGFKRFIDHIIDAKYNSIVIFGEMEIPGEDDDMERVPHIEGGKAFQVCRYIIGQFDVGIRYSVSRSLSQPGHTVRIALAQPSGQFWAKDRYSALGDYQLVEPGDFGAMADFIAMIEDASNV